MDAMLLTRSLIALRDRNRSCRRSEASSLICRKILVEDFNGEKCDELHMRRDKATCYGTNCCASWARSMDGWCESPIGPLVFQVTVRV